MAKLAKQGKGKKVRFQGGTTFPLIIAIVAVLGLALVTYAKLSGPGDGEGRPSSTLGDHWHHAFGIYVCDQYLPDLLGNAETPTENVNGQQLPANLDFRNTGIHSHDDGVIHYHPNSLRSSGNRAKLGVFLDVYDIEVDEDDDRIVLPADQVAAGELTEYSPDTVKADPLFAACADDDLQVKLFVWDNYANHSEFQTFTADLADAPMKRDGMIFVLALVPNDKVPPVPGWACELPTLGVSDLGAGQQSDLEAQGNDCGVPETTTTVTGESTTTVTGDSTPSSEPTTSDPAATDPPSTDTPSTDTPSTDTATPTTGG